MIEHTDDEVVRWLASVVDPVVVTLGAPPAVPDRPAGVACHLLSLVPSPPGRTSHRPPVQALARYLVTSWAPAPADAHRLLGQVLVAASDRADLDLEQVEPPVGLWSALGVPVQPALVVRATVRWSRPEPRAPLVRERVRVDWRGLRPLVGVVVAPGGTPIARAQLRLPGSEGPAWTGADGGFVLPGVPISTNPLPVTVMARGVTRTVAVTAPDDPSDPLTIIFDPEE